MAMIAGHIFIHQALALAESEGASNTIGPLSNQALRMLKMDVCIIPDDLEVVTRAEARAKGLPRYFLGVPCKAGHVSTRRTGDCHCTECHRLKMAASRLLPGSLERRREWKKIYVAANQEKFALYISQWRLKNKALLQEKTRAYNQKTLAERNARSKKWRLANQEREKNYRMTQEKKDPQLFKLRKKTYAHRRRLRKAESQDYFTAKDVQNIKIQQKNKCVYCSRDIRKTYHIDHIIPLALGGNNSRRNIQVLCPDCNLKKSSKHPVDWAREIGMLL